MYAVCIIRYLETSQGTLQNFVTIRRPFLTILLVQHWLVKQEPEDYSWANFVNDKRIAWTGVRNFQARNNLRAMKKNDLVLFYHSVSEKQVVGIARVQKESYPDPTASEGDWSCVDLAPVRELKNPVTLDQIKANKVLKNNALVRQSRLSVIPLKPEEFKLILHLADTSLPANRK